MLVLPESSKFPGDSSKKSRTRKKIADRTPSEVEKPGKTHFLGVNNGPKCTHLGSKWWQTGAEIACGVAAVAVRDAGVGGY
jgi:hypothetical protein